MKKTLAILSALAVGLMIAGPAGAGISGTAHDLSSETYTGGQICNVCHVPHNATQNALLWSRTASSVDYGTGTTSVKGTTWQPGTISLLCLSCHDGTVSLDSFVGAADTSGSVITGDADIIDEGATEPLAGNHPVGVTYPDGDADYVAEASLNAAIILASSKVECSSCHDVHDDANGNFLVLSNAGSALCISCHVK